MYDFREFGFDRVIVNVSEVNLGLARWLGWKRRPYTQRLWVRSPVGMSMGGTRRCSSLSGTSRSLPLSKRVVSSGCKRKRIRLGSLGLRAGSSLAGAYQTSGVFQTGKQMAPLLQHRVCQQGDGSPNVNPGGREGGSLSQLFFTSLPLDFG